MMFVSSLDFDTTARSGHGSNWYHARLYLDRKERTPAFQDASKRRGQVLRL